MQQVLTVLQILVAVGLIALVLLQQGRGADAGAAFGSGSSGTLFGSRGSASFLSRATAVLAAVFFANSIALAYIATTSVERGSVVERFDSGAPAGAGGEPVPEPGTFVSDVPQTPDAGATGGNGESDVPRLPGQEGEAAKE